MYLLANGKKSAFGAGKVVWGCHHFITEVEHVKVKTAWNLRKFHFTDGNSVIYSPANI